MAQFQVKPIIEKGRQKFAIFNASGKQVGKSYNTPEGANRKLGKKESGKNA